MSLAYKSYWLKVSIPPKPKPHRKPKQHRDNPYNQIQLSPHATEI